MGCSASLVLPSGDQPYEHVGFLQSSMKSLDKYFYLLHNNIRTENTDEIVHLREGVEKCMHSLIKLVSLKDTRLSVDNNQLLKVGSIYEGTKVGKSDQFDYIVVLSELERNEVIIEDLNHPVNGTDVKVCIPRNEYLGDKRKEYKEFEDMWADITANFYLMGMKTKKNNKLGLLDIFEKCIRKVSMFIPPFKTKLGTLEIDNTKRVCKEGSSVRIIFKWTKWWFEIEELRRVDKTSTESIVVNLTPAIKVKEITEFVSLNDPMDATLYDKMIDKGFFLVIPNYNGHFKKVFTNTEVGLMKELPVRHIKAYRVLKFLINGNERIRDETLFRNVDFRVFDSFALKMLMISNAETCPCMKHSDFELFDCVNHVLQKMYRNLYEVTDDGFEICPNVFIHTAPLTSFNIDIVRLNRYYLSELIKHDLKIWIGEREKYDFKSTSKIFGIVPLNTKIINNLKALNPD